MAIIYGSTDSEKQLLKNYPKEVQSIDDIPQMHEKFKAKLDEPVSGIFAPVRKWNRKRQVNKFEKNKYNPFHAGARGEISVIDKLSQLNDNYHVLCGVRIELPYWVSYNGKKNLRSAQMDFVIVCKKGVFMIEVKNWRDGSNATHNGFNPYEQTERAGRVLWIFLQSWRSKPRVTNVLLSILGNIEYNQQYKAVFVSSLDKINWFLEKRENVLSDKDIKKIVNKLKNHVTK